MHVAFKRLARFVLLLCSVPPKQASRVPITAVSSSEREKSESGKQSDIGSMHACFSVSTYSTKKTASVGYEYPISNQVGTS
jgi:hypothetical protein